MLIGRGYPEDKGNSEGEIRQLIDSCGLEDRVILTGYAEDVARWYQAFDAFCLPSFSEGLPVSVLEAMASGVPVVGSNVRGIREVIIPEQNGVLFPSDDDGALATNLGRLIRDVDFRRRLSNNAFAFVCEKHGARAWVSEYERLFKLA